MSHLTLKDDNLKPWFDEAAVSQLQSRVDWVHNLLKIGEGEGAEFLGWLHLPSKMDQEEFERIRETAKTVQDQCEALICIGIGGSYLGAKSGIEFVRNAFHNQKPEDGIPEVYFAGHNISSDTMADLLRLIEDKEICLNVISKSGTTTEPAIAFRILKEHIEKKYGKEEASKRIIVTTDREKGALRQLADSEGYASFVIPDDVGGRYSVLTPVGLLPMAIAGIDIDEVVKGARHFELKANVNSFLEENIACRYALMRNILYHQGKTIEIMATFHPALFHMAEWWKQLAGESEGKDGKGIFPASVHYTTDLHSMGQWVQEGNRIIFETFLCVQESNSQIEVPRFDDDGDGLNYLAGKSLDEINHKAYLGTAQAHLEGDVPNMTLFVKDRSPYSLGQLYYFFELSIAISGYLLKVNPFDQPGVEFYKKNMFRLLEKPGFEKGN